MRVEFFSRLFRFVEFEFPDGENFELIISDNSYIELSTFNELFGNGINTPFLVNKTDSFLKFFVVMYYRYLTDSKRCFFMTSLLFWGML